MALGTSTSIHRAFKNHGKNAIKLATREYVDELIKQLQEIIL